MQEDLKTVEGELRFSDPLKDKQIEDVQKMRTSLLACSSNVIDIRHALNSITIMQIYHQLTRVVRFTEMMDKIEDTLYASMDAAIDQINTSNSSAWISLMTMQSQLQKNMMDSQKLLQPYLDMLTSVDAFVSTADELTETPDEIMNQTSREKLRNAAQLVLASLPESKS